MARIAESQKNVVWQLERISVYYSPVNMGGRLVRRFIESVNGRRRTFPLKGIAHEDEILGFLQRLRNDSGQHPLKHRKLTVGTLKTKYPTIQGMWSSGPDLWKDPMPRSESAEKDELEIRKVFRSMNSELGMEGTLSTLRTLRKTEIQVERRILFERQESKTGHSRDSLGRYYSQVYVPQKLEQEEAIRARIKGPPLDSDVREQEVVPPVPYKLPKTLGMRKRFFSTASVGLRSVLGSRSTGRLFSRATLFTTSYRGEAAGGEGEDGDKDGDDNDYDEEEDSDEDDFGEAHIDDEDDYDIERLHLEHTDFEDEDIFNMDDEDDFDDDDSEELEERVGDPSFDQLFDNEGWDDNEREEIILDTEEASSGVSKAQ